MARWRLKLLDAPLLVLLAGAAFLPWLIADDAGLYVVISHVGGEERLPLDEPATLSLEGPVGLTVVQVAQGEAWVEESDCPDKLCVRMGRISRVGESAVCAPNRVALTIIGASGGEDEGDPDGVDAVSR
jgi:hypothetical protein